MLATSWLWQCPQTSLFFLLLWAVLVSECLKRTDWSDLTFWRWEKLIDSLENMGHLWISSRLSWGPKGCGWRGGRTAYLLKLSLENLPDLEQEVSSFELIVAISFTQKKVYSLERTYSLIHATNTPAYIYLLWFCIIQYETFYSCISRRN